MSTRKKKEVQKHLKNIARITGDERSVMQDGLFRADILVEKADRLAQIAKVKRDDLKSEIEWAENVIKSYYTNFVDAFSTNEDWKKFLEEEKE